MIDNHQNKLELFKSNPSKALWTLSIPMMLGMSVQAIYMLIDTAFIGNWVGGSALAGLGLVFPPLFIIMGITFGLGSGATTVIAKSIGEENKENADSAADHIIFLGILLSLFFIVIGYFFGENIIKYQSTDPLIVKHASDYFFTMLSGTFFMIMSIFFRSILSGEGDNLFPMKVLGLGTLINLILDPILIYYYQIKGAALATVISQVIVFIIFTFIMIFKKHTYITINLSKFKFNYNILMQILRLGIPASLSMLIMSIGLFFYNKILAMTEFPLEAIAAYSTAHRIEHLFFIPIISIATSMVTLVGMFYGSKRLDLINKVVSYGLSNALAISCIFGLLFFTSSQFIFPIFTDNIKIIKIGVEYFKIFSFAIPLVTLTMICSRVMQGLGKAYPMLIITCLRVIIISCSLAYLFIEVMNKPLYFAWISILLSCLASSLLAVIWMINIKKKIRFN
tara:strand:- start:947 stop:2302 length:1356 start_codon:yes stop_codon:yes gene_type:complete